MALEALIKDIKAEKCLWTTAPSTNSEEEKEAWARVGSKNNLTASEARSTFNLLCKKFMQEKQKPKSTWKLFDQFKSMSNEPPHTAQVQSTQLNKETQNEKTFSNNKQKEKARSKQASPTQFFEEDTYVELLEVKEEFSDDEQQYTEKRTEENKKVIKSSNENNKDQTVNVPALQQPSPKGDNAKVTTNNNKDILQKRKRYDSGQDNGDEISEKRLRDESMLNESADMKIDIKPDTIAQINGIANTTQKDHEYTSFGLYVASTLSKLPPNYAAKLEVKVLQAIIDVKSHTIDK